MDNESKKKLKLLFDAVIAETETNEVFAKTIEEIIGSGIEDIKIDKAVGGKSQTRRNRRDKAVIDPVALYEAGENIQERLSILSEKELKDIIAEYGMDNSKLAMKWKDKERLINLIVDTACRRAAKGDAFRNKNMKT